MYDLSGTPIFMTRPSWQSAAPVVVSLYGESGCPDTTGFIFSQLVAVEEAGEGLCFESLALIPSSLCGVHDIPHVSNGQNMVVWECKCKLQSQNLAFVVRSDRDLEE